MEPFLGAQAPLSVTAQKREVAGHRLFSTLLITQQQERLRPRSPPDGEMPPPVGAGARTPTTRWSTERTAMTSPSASNGEIRRTMRVSATRCSTNFTVHSRLIRSKELRMSASRIPFTRLRSTPTVSASSASCGPRSGRNPQLQPWKSAPPRSSKGMMFARWSPRPVGQTCSPGPRSRLDVAVRSPRPDRFAARAGHGTLPDGSGPSGRLTRLTARHPLRGLAAPSATRSFPAADRR